MDYDDKVKNIFRVIGIIILVVCLVAVFIYFNEPDNKIENMEIEFVKTNDDADCTILINRDKVIIIDTGEEQDFEQIQKVLNKYKVKKVDCMIITHPDKDHIGSALKIAQNYQIELVIEPYFSKENKRLNILNQYLKDNQIKRLVLSNRRKFVYGDINLTIYPPNEFEYNNKNNYSLAIMLDHQNVSMFIAGDAYIKRTQELLALPLNQVDLYKVNYHGRDYEGSIALLKKLDPKNVVITANKAGKYLNKQLEGYPVYYTLREELHFTSNGVKVEIKY